MFRLLLVGIPVNVPKSSGIVGQIYQGPSVLQYSLRLYLSLCRSLIPVTTLIVFPLIPSIYLPKVKVCTLVSCWIPRRTLSSSFQHL